MSIIELIRVWLSIIGLLPFPSDSAVLMTWDPHHERFTSKVRMWWKFNFVIIYFLVFRWYTNIEIPSYFFMTLSYTEAVHSFVSHFNQYNMVDPSWGNIPSWVWPGELVIDLENYDAEFDSTVILETECHYNNNIVISHPGSTNAT